MLLRKILGIVFISLILAAKLGATPLSGDDFANIVALLKEHKLSEEQSAEIKSLIARSAASKRLFSESFILDYAPPQKKLKLSDKTKPQLPLGAKSVAQNGDAHSYLSPKKSGPFGKIVLDRKSGDHVRNRKDVIYLWTGVQNHEDEYVQYDDRINADKYENMKLDLALFDVEVKIRNLIKQNKLLYKRTIYAGLALDASNRARSHKTDVQSCVDKPDEFRAINSSRKLRWFDALQKRGFNARMSPIIENIPEDYIKPFEVLVGHLFNTPSKGSTILGDDAAYLRVLKYLGSEKRKNKLAALELLTTVEDLVGEEQDFMLGMDLSERI